MALRSLMLLMCLILSTVLPSASAQDDAGIAAEAAGTEVGEADFNVPEEGFDAPSANRAALIAHKHVQEDYIVHGRNMTVALKLFNVGTGCGTSLRVV